MIYSNKKFKEKLPDNRSKAWLLPLFVLIAIVACTSDLDNDGAPLLGPSFGVSLVPSGVHVAKGGTQTFTALGGVTPYTYSLSATDIGTITGAGVFTALQIAGTATVTVVDTVGDTGTGTVTVVPTQLVIAPGSYVLTAAGDAAYTATLNSGSNLVVCSIARDNSSGTTTMPTLAVAANICTATAGAIPSSGTETFTVTITDSQGGDYASAQLTLGAP